MFSLILLLFSLIFHSRCSECKPKAEANEIMSKYKNLLPFDFNQVEELYMNETDVVIQKTGFKFGTLLDVSMTLEDGKEVWMKIHVDLRKEGYVQALSIDSKRQNDDQEYVKLCVLNVWNYMEDYGKRVKKIQREINGDRCDVVLLQEMRSRLKSLQHKTEWIISDLVSKDKKQRAFVFEPAMTYTGVTLEREGLGVISNYPFVESVALPLSRNERDHRDEHQRILLRTTMRWGSSLVHLYNVHNSLSQAAQRRNVVEMWHELEKRKGEMQIIAGDFNCIETDFFYQFLVGEKEIDGLKGNFVDVFRLLRRDKKDKGHTFYAWELNRRIDFVLVRNFDASWSPIQFDLFGKAEKKSLAMSDHLGIRVLFQRSQLSE